jgi:hypothetical protein
MGLTKHILKEISDARKNALWDYYSKFKRTTDPIVASNFDKLIKSDPTPNGTYLNWIFNLHKNGKLKVEDAYKATPSFEFMFKYKDKLKSLNINPDINSYKSLNDLMDATEPHIETVQKEIETKDSETNRLYEDDEWLLIIPLTEKASCKYGANTRWCTAGEKDNRFEEEIEFGHLYILINKRENTKWQWHFGTMQFMDAKDDKVNPNDVIPKTPTEIQNIFDLKTWTTNPIKTLLRGHEEAGNYKNGVLTGNFDCSEMNIKSLNGSPREVTGNFWCSGNELTTLEGAPTKVGGWFDCTFNNLTSLRGAPIEVGRDFDCGNNKLKTLDGAPRTFRGSFGCHKNILKTLKGIPKEIDGNLVASFNDIYKLEDMPTYIGGYIDLTSNSLETLDDMPTTYNTTLYIAKNRLQLRHIEEYKKRNPDIRIIN